MKTADPDGVSKQMEKLFDVKQDEILRVRCKLPHSKCHNWRKELLPSHQHSCNYNVTQCCSLCHCFFTTNFVHVFQEDVLLIFVSSSYWQCMKYREVEVITILIIIIYLFYVQISAKTGTGIGHILETIVEHLPWWVGAEYTDGGSKFKHLML